MHAGLPFVNFCNFGCYENVDEAINRAWTNKLLPILYRTQVFEMIIYSKVYF